MCPPGSARQRHASMPTEPARTVPGPAARDTSGAEPRRRRGRPGAGSPTARRAAGPRRRRRSAARPARPAPPSTRPGPRWNIDSPANSPPIPTPYSPPASSPSRQASTECAQPSRCSSPYAVGDVAGDPARRRGAGRRRPATTSSNAVSTRISKSRQERRSDRETTSPSSGRIPRSHRARTSASAAARRARASGRARAGTPPAGSPARGRRRSRPGRPRRRRGSGNDPARRRRLDRHGRRSGLGTGTLRRIDGMGVTSKAAGAVGKQLAPRIGELAPGLTTSFVREALHRAIDGVGPLPPAARGRRRPAARAEGRRRARPSTR